MTVEEVEHYICETLHKEGDLWIQLADLLRTRDELLNEMETTND